MDTILFVEGLGLGFGAGITAGLFYIVILEGIDYFTEKR